MDRKTETAELTVIDLGAASVETQGGNGPAFEQGIVLGPDSICDE